MVAIIPLLETRGVTFHYPGNQVLKNIDLSINRGEIFCLLGPNGCGKTTLLDCVLGLLKAQRGEIKLNGISINDLTPQKLARHVAYVPQSHEKTFPYTVAQMVLMGRASYLGMFDSPGQEDMAAVEEALELVGIIRLKDRPYTQLSGGEGQLVMVARALAQKTPLIVMDEPTAHLDFKHEMVIMETIVDMVQTAGLSVLMATHMPNHCFYFENRGIPTWVAMIKNRGFLAQGSPSEVLTERALGELYHVRTRVVSCGLENDQQLKQVVPISTIA